MAVDDADELVAFQNVRVIRSAAQALLCRIAEKNVWLPRGHIAGKLWCAGDRGMLFIRRWVARDRHLIDLRGVAIASPVRSISRRPRPDLSLVRRDRDSHAD
jgi:hypothetical protein